MTAAVQRQQVAVAARAIAPLLDAHRLVITHGNGPQVGYLAGLHEGTPGAFPLDVVDAESEGMIGYLVEQELAILRPQRDIVAMLTQVLVDRDDPAFDDPQKPIGPVVDAATAAVLGEQLAWSFEPVDGGFRRVVASPRPRGIVERRVIELLVGLDVVVVCAGGGGIPVALDARGARRGVEAVVDKDRTSALLATELRADRLLLLTDVDGVYRDWATPAARRIERATPAALAELRLDPGSMGPKIEAARAFAATGGVACIGRLEDAAALVEGRTGTQIGPFDPD
jgi:carbamate kinase